jgi:hypothetical protein
LWATALREARRKENAPVKALRWEFDYELWIIRDEVTLSVMIVTGKM